MVVVVPFAMLLVSWVFHLGRRSVQYSGLLLLGTIVQTSVFAVLMESAPILAAFHPVLAVLLFAGGGLVVWYAWALARGPVDVVVPAARECVPSGEGLASGEGWLRARAPSMRRCRPTTVGSRRGSDEN